jgi:hypothetical protein
VEVPPVDPVVPAEFGFCEAPEVLDAVHVAALAVGKLLPMVDPVVFVPVRDGSVIALERVGVDGRPLRYPEFDGEAKDRAGYVRNEPAAPLPRMPFRTPPKYDSSISTSPSRSDSSSQERAMR